MENSGFVYGEILHTIMNKVVKDIIIHMSNAEVYHYKTNMFRTAKYIPYISSEEKHVIHFRHEWDLNKPIRLKIYYTDMINNKESCLDLESDVYNSSISIEKEYRNIDMCGYYYRQQALELMYIVRNIDDSIKMLSIQDKWDNPEGPVTLVFIKEHIEKIFEELTAYQQEHDRTNDLLFKSVSDDLYITLKSINVNMETNNNSIGSKYILGRHLSQGQQRGYNICDITPLLNPQPHIRPFNNLFSPSSQGGFIPTQQRQNINQIVQSPSFYNLTPNNQIYQSQMDPDNIFGDYDDAQMDMSGTNVTNENPFQQSIDRYQISQDPISSFSTPAKTSVMRNISNK